MGQKVNPISLRLKVNRTWDSRWYASDRDYGTYLHQDIKIREFLLSPLDAKVSDLMDFNYSFLNTWCIFYDITIIQIY
jgi:hypothetical protein